MLFSLQSCCYYPHNWELSTFYRILFDTIASKNDYFYKSQQQSIIGAELNQTFIYYFTSFCNKKLAGCNERPFSEVTEIDWWMGPGDTLINLGSPAAYFRLNFNRSDTKCAQVCNSNRIFGPTLMSISICSFTEYLQVPNDNFLIKCNKIVLNMFSLAFKFLYDLFFVCYFSKTI